MKHLAMILVVLGVCVGALGASGFHRPMGVEAGSGGPTRERNALTFFVAGVTSLTLGGFLVRQSRRSGDHHAVEAEKDAARASLEAILTIVADLDRRRETESAHEIRVAIDSLMREAFFDLTSKADDLMLLLGFQDYARVWDGVATGERLLNRCWSLCTDGYEEEGLAELPLAHAALRSAAEAMRTI